MITVPAIVFGTIIGIIIIYRKESIDLSLTLPTAKTSTATTIDFNTTWVD